jgi:hypothetical protein
MDNMIYDLSDIQMSYQATEYDIFYGWYSSTYNYEIPCDESMIKVTNNIYIYIYCIHCIGIQIINKFH